MRKFLTLIFLTFTFASFSQKLDSLLAELKHAKVDSVKLNVTLAIVDYYAKTDPDQSHAYLKDALAMAKRSGDKSKEARTYMKMGVYYRTDDKFDTAITYFELSRQLYKALGDENSAASVSFNIATTKGNLGLPDESLKELEELLVYFKKTGNYEREGMCYSNMADTYDGMGQLDKSMELFLKALNLFETHGFPDRRARSLNAIAGIFREKRDYSKAIDYAMQGLKIREEKKDLVAMGVSYSSLANIYAAMEDNTHALFYMRKCVSLYTQLNMRHGLAVVYGNMGNIYEDINLDSAIYFHNHSLEIHREYNTPSGIAAEQINIARIYLNQDKFDACYKALQEAERIGKEIKIIELLKNAYSLMGELFYYKKEYKKAYEYLDLYTNLNDSILNLESSKQIGEMEAKYQNEKKNLEIDNLQKDKVIQQSEIQRQGAYKLAFGLGFCLMLILAVVIYRSYDSKKKDNKIISFQKELVEEKQKEIVSSITYAKRLQDAILPPLNDIQQALPDSFVLYKPKDIVAGDFYWMETVESSEMRAKSEKENSQLSTPNSKLIFIAAADCTGHGVPGAMVSVVCSNALNRTVKEFGIREPGKILDKVRELVIETFEKSADEVKDGMDISLCCIQRNPDSGAALIQWSGANNPLWLISKDKGTVTELKPDKQPIGKVDQPKPFNTHSIELEKGDALYLFTDGYADQFGGPNGKKFKYKQMEQLITANRHLDMAAQKTVLEHAFETWRASLEQVDDVCIIGIRL